MKGKHKITLRFVIFLFGKFVGTRVFHKSPIEF